MSDASEPVIEAPVGDPAEPVAQEPVEAAPAEPIEPGVEAAPAEPSAEEPAVEVEDPFASYGGKDTIEAAVRLYEASRTEDGVIELFLEAGRSLGVGLDRMQALFNELAGPTEPEEEVDLDEPMTRKEFLDLQAKQQAEIQARADAQNLETNRAALHSVTGELGIPEGTTMQVVLGMADQHLKGASPTPESINSAVRKAWSEYQAEVEKQAQQYLKTKAEKAEAVPSAPAGSGAPSEPAPAEPVDVAEAIKRARLKLGF